jgi:hypothetical protein
VSLTSRIFVFASFCCVMYCAAALASSLLVGDTRKKFLIRAPP